MEVGCNTEKTTQPNSSPFVRVFLLLKRAKMSYCIFMGIIWIILLLASCIVAIFTNPAVAIIAMNKGANEAVTLALTLVALYGLWLGMLAIMDKLGIMEKLAKLLRPIIRFLFGKDIDNQTQKYIATNISANMLGLGNAATPMGIAAINSLDKGQKKASTAQIMLVVISCTSLQLLPTTVIGLLVSNGSTTPTAFLVPSIIATVASTTIGITSVKLLSKIFDKKTGKKKTKLTDQL